MHPGVSKPRNDFANGNDRDGRGKVGTRQGDFHGQSHLVGFDPPNGYRISGEGSGGVAGFAKGGATVKLELPSEDVTNLAYQVDAQIGGKLAQLGGRLID